MKFGKTIKRAESASGLYTDKWMSYKDLKKLIKDIVSASNKIKHHNNESSSGDSDPAVVNKSSLLLLEEEKIFFREVKLQLTAVDLYFNTIEKQLQDQYNAFLKKMPENVEECNEGEVAKMKAECRKLHMDLIMLENYAVINYCGFSKITKKHDKNTGFETRHKFMSKIVNTLNFSSYPNVVSLLEQLESIFNKLEMVSKKEMLAKARSLSNEERLMELDEVKEEKKILQSEIKEGESAMEDPFDVLVRAATENTDSPLKNKRPHSVKEAKPNKKTKK